MRKGCPARCNPFRTVRIEALSFRFGEDGWQGEDAWKALMEKWRGLDCRAALVGAKGSGKTTLLEEMEGRLKAAGWRLCRWRLSEEHRRPSAGDWSRVAAGGPGDLLTLDGAEQLSWWRWRRLARLSRGLGGMLITSHQPGLLPSLHEHRTDCRLLHNLVREILLDQPESLPSNEVLNELFETHEGNIRSCLRSLYDLWAQTTSASSPSFSATRRAVEASDSLA